MKITREIEFQAATESEAYTRARERLGPDGVILSIQTIKIPGMIPFLRKKALLVRAGILAEDEPPRKPEPDPEMERRQMAVFQALLERRRRGSDPREDGAADPAERVAAKTADSVDLGGAEKRAESDVSAETSEGVDQLDSASIGGQEQAPQDPVLEALLGKDVSPTVARGLVEKHAVTGGGRSFESWLSERMDLVCASPEGDFNEALGGKRIMVVGPTGVGKTTSIAKLAAMAIQSDRKVCLFTSDNYRVSAVEQIRTFARVLSVPLEVVNAGSEIPALLEKYPPETLMIMDTTGHGFRESSRVAQIRSVHDHFRPDAVHIAAAAPSRLQDVTVSVERVREAFPVSHLMLTKVDETTCSGAVLSIPLELEMPVSFVTTGQNVPRDLHLATGDFLVRTVFPGGELT